LKQAWIRGPLWDGFWILSGLPIGLILVALSKTVPQTLLTFSLLVALQTGHLLSPIALAWLVPGFRKIMLTQRIKYIGVPLLVLAVPTVIAAVASEGLTEYRPNLSIALQINQWPDGKNPYLMMIWVYAVWNIYHFGMQNFGVLSIYRRKAGTGSRRVDMTFCLVITSVAMFLGVPISFIRVWDLRWPCVALSLVVTGGMVWRQIKGDLSLPRMLFILTDGLALALLFWQPLIGFAVYAMNHWLVAIGLSSHVHATSRGKSPIVFAVVVILVGILCFGMLFVRPTATAGIAIHITMVAFGVRVGLGCVHFLYDRYIYKFSDERVRATIGGALGEY
jgi:hypothetical protein